MEPNISFSGIKVILKCFKFYSLWIKSKLMESLIKDKDSNFVNIIWLMFILFSKLYSKWMFFNESFELSNNLSLIYEVRCPSQSENSSNVEGKSLL